MRIVGLTTTFVRIGSETFGFSSEMFTPQQILDSYPKMLLIPILAAEHLKLCLKSSPSIQKLVLSTVCNILSEYHGYGKVVLTINCVDLYNPIHFLTDYKDTCEWTHLARLYYSFLTELM